MTKSRTPDGSAVTHATSYMCIRMAAKWGRKAPGLMAMTEERAIATYPWIQHECTWTGHSLSVVRTRRQRQRVKRVNRVAAIAFAHLHCARGALSTKVCVHAFASDSSKGGGSAGNERRGCQDQG